MELHALELTNSGLINLGKPEGYVARQVAGWSERYIQAQTDDIPELKDAFEWLALNQPEYSSVAFIHNDFKFDNMVIREDASVAAILDWEMATVGDPLMDLGTTLAYWAEEGDPDGGHDADHDPGTAGGVAHRSGELGHHAARGRSARHERR